MLCFIESLDGNPTPEKSSALVPVHGQQSLRLLRQDDCKLFGALRQRGRELRQNRLQNFRRVWPQKAANESKFFPHVCLRVIVWIAQCAGQQLMSRITDAAQIDLRFGNPARKFLNFSIGVCPGDFASKRVRFFGQGWIGTNG